MGQVGGGIIGGDAPIVPSSGASVPPNGPATGDLYGFYPNPQVSGIHSQPISFTLAQPGESLVLSTGGTYTPRVQSQLIDTIRTNSVVTTSNSPANAVTYLSLSTSTPVAGYYRLIISLAFSVSQSNTAIWYNVFTNGVGSQMGAAFEPIGIANGTIYRTGSDVFPLPAFALTVEVKFAKNSGPGSVSATFGNIHLSREQ